MFFIMLNNTECIIFVTMVALSLSQVLRDHLLACLLVVEKLIESIAGR
jgi:hypothetical protein